MQYLHVKNIQLNHPKYKDRDIRWAKIFMNMLDGQAYNTITEIDKWRLVAFIFLELQEKKEVLMDEDYLTRKGFDFTQRSLEATLTALHPLIDLVDEPSAEGTVLKRIIKPKSEKDIQLDNNCKELFNFWNTQGSIKHRDYLKYYPCIKSRLEKYSLEELKDAIINYSTILRGKEYFWEYKWTINEFLTRKNGLDRFTKENFDANNYKKRADLGSSLDSKLKGLEDFENE